MGAKGLLLGFVAGVSLLTLMGQASINSSGTGISRSRASIVSLSLGNLLLFNATAPTISSGFGTSPSVTSSNGSATFRVNVGTGGAATSGVVGLPTATTGWNCIIIDTHATTPQVTRQTASAVNTSTWTAAAAWTASTILLAHCEGF